MEAKGLDMDSLALMALADPTSTVVETGHRHTIQLYPKDSHVNSVSDTGMLRALRAEGVASLDDLRRLSKQIRKDRQLKQASAGKK